jgi:RimJ/RimL family protein N-acetyltransferase
MGERFEYCLALTELAPIDPLAGDLRLRIAVAHPAPVVALADLMIDAYRGTIDYDGETLADATAEVERYLAGTHGVTPLLNDSRLAFDGDVLAGACLVSQWEQRQCPLIAYVMTRAAWKGHGLAGQLVRASLQALAGRGCAEVRAVITAGNEPSERLFTRLGFQVLVG